PLIIESLRLWEGMNEAVGAETGFRRTGILYLCANDAALAKRTAWLEHSRSYQLDSRLLAAGEIEKLAPGATRPSAGALYPASDGRAEPQKAAPAIAAGAQRRGAILLAPCAVRGIETAAGRVAAVVTAKGRIACS